MNDYISREEVCYQLAKQATIDGQPRAIKRAAKIVADSPAADVVPWEWLERYADLFCALVSYLVSYPEFIREAKRFYEASLAAMEGGHISE